MSGPGPQIMQASSVRNGSTLPSSPAVGAVFEKTSGGSEGLYSASAAGVWTGPYGTGSGTVTNVSVVTANGVSGSVATATTTPAITLTLGAITPSSIISSGNHVASNVSPGFATTATAAATTTLTVASKGVQAFTGSTTQTVVLPVVSTLPQTGFGFVIQNDSSGALTVNSSGGNLVQTMAAGTRATFTCKLLTGTDAASWNVTYIAPAGVGGSGTNNTIAKFTPDGTHVGDSRVLEDATSLGLNGGVGAGSGTLDMAGSVAFKGANSGNSLTVSSGQVIFGDPNNDVNHTYFQLDDAIKTITQSAGTESISIDGTAHTITNTAAQSISNITALWGAGSDGTKFQIDGDGKIQNYGDAPFNNGELIIGNDNGVASKATLSQGAGVLISNGPGSITIAADPTNLGTILPVDMSNGVLSQATGTVYASPGTTSGLTATTEGAVSFPVTRAGTIRNLYVRTGTTAKVNTPATVITIRKNGVDTAVTVTMTQTTSTTTSDTTHSFTVIAGDLITLSFVTTGAAAVSTSIAGVSFELD